MTEQDRQQRSQHSGAEGIHATAASGGPDSASTVPESLKGASPGEATTTTRYPGHVTRWKAAPRPSSLAGLTPYLAVGAGGMLGANARYLVNIWAIDQWGAVFPWATLIVNVLGSFLASFILTFGTERWMTSPQIRLLLVTGFTGSFTTLSIYSYEMVTLLRAGEMVAALGYSIGSLVLGGLAVLAGIIVARLL